MAVRAKYRTKPVLGAASPKTPYDPSPCDLTNHDQETHDPTPRVSETCDLKEARLQEEESERQASKRQDGKRQEPES